MSSYNQWRIQRIIVTVLKYLGALITIVQFIQLFL